MPPQELAKIDMTRIDFINQLYGERPARRTQARAAPQGALHEHHDDRHAAGRRGQRRAGNAAQVVSGVGGQYNFVAMAHALPDARLLMMLRATHDNKDGLKQQHRLELRPRDHPAPPARHRHHRVRRGRPARPE
jgi:hypothetical protein